MGIKFSRLSVAVLLSVVLALGASLAVAHSHDGHQADQCSFSVAQSASTIVAPDSLLIPSTTGSLNQPIVDIGSIVYAPRAKFHARAPPCNL